MDTDAQLCCFLTSFPTILCPLLCRPTMDANAQFCCFCATYLATFRLHSRGMDPNTQLC